MDKLFKQLVDELKRRTRGQQTPIEYGEEDYWSFVLFGIRQLYIDLGEGAQYDEYFDQLNMKFLIAPTITRQEYITVVSLINFYETVIQDVSTIVGYSTDSLTITNADKPYANISNEVRLLELRRTELFWKIRSESEG